MPIQPDNPFINRNDLLTLIRAEFVAYSTAHGQNYNDERNKVLKAIGDTTDPKSPAGIIAQRQHDGKGAACAAQILGELGWLSKYCTDWSIAKERTDALMAALSAPDTVDPVQVEDGSWGGCIREWYRKLEPTVDALQVLPDKGPKLKPLAFMAPLNDAKKTMDRMWQLQLSDIRTTGRNNRDELGAMQTALSQLIFKDSLHDALHDNADLGFTISDELEDDYVDYLAQTQSPRTGFWGPWYRIGGQLLQVQDVSFTFHVVNYRSGVIHRWPLVVETTLAIETLDYPAGWKPAKTTAKYNQHNNYDIATLFALGWPHMTADQKTRVRAKLGEMLTWCLVTSMDKTGFLGETNYSITDTYYYGVRFLDRLGFWDPSKRFWLHRAPDITGAPDPGPLATLLSANFEKLNDKSSESQTVRAILKTAGCLTGGTAPPDDG